LRIVFTVLLKIILKARVATISIFISSHCLALLVDPQAQLLSILLLTLPTFYIPKEIISRILSEAAYRE